MSEVCEGRIDGDRERDGLSPMVFVEGSMRVVDAVNRDESTLAAAEVNERDRERRRKPLRFPDRFDDFVAIAKLVLAGMD